MLRPRHPRDHELLMALDGELARRQQAGVDSHVPACGMCQSRSDRIRTALGDVSGLGASGSRAPEPPHRASRLRLERALQEAAREWRPSWLARLRYACAGSAPEPSLGLAVVVALLAILWMSSSSESVRVPISSGAPLPIASLTPGAVSGLTAAELCAGARPSRVVTADTRARVLSDYRMEYVSARTYELDALITPELGGTTEPDNLWPQHYASPVWNARIKDELELLLPRLVCSHQLALGLAQREIAADWVAAYKRYFKTDVPLRAHVVAAMTEDDDLEFAPARYVAANAAPANTMPLALAVRFVQP